MKWLHLYFNRFHKRNLKKTILIYSTALIILILFGVKGLMITFFMMLCFVMGWISKGMIQAIKDYRLSLQLNRIKFSEMDYETLKRENKAYLTALQQRDRQDKNSRGGGRGVQSPRASSPAYDFDRIEELKMRYKEEETEEYR